MTTSPIIFDTEHLVLASFIKIPDETKEAFFLRRSCVCSTEYPRAAEGIPKCVYHLKAQQEHGYDPFGHWGLIPKLRAGAALLSSSFQGNGTLLLMCHFHRPEIELRDEQNPRDRSLDQACRRRGDNMYNHRCPIQADVLILVPRSFLDQPWKALRATGKVLY